MARLPDDLIARIKKEIPLEELCRDYGIELAGSGKNLLGKCPLHDDDEPSFAVTPSKNLWNCLAGCGKMMTGGQPEPPRRRYPGLRPGSPPNIAPWTPPDRA